MAKRFSSDDQVQVIRCYTPQSHKLVYIEVPSPDNLTEVDKDYLILVMQTLMQMGLPKEPMEAE